MSNLNNDIKRLRNKLKIFEMEGSGQLMNDLLNLGVLPSFSSTDQVIRRLRAEYQKELDDLLARQEKLEQGKLDL